MQDFQYLAASSCCENHLFCCFHCLQLRDRNETLRDVTFANKTTLFESDLYVAALPEMTVKVIYKITAVEENDSDVTNHLKT